MFGFGRVSQISPDPQSVIVGVVPNRPGVLASVVSFVKTWKMQIFVGVCVVLLIVLSVLFFYFGNISQKKYNNKMNNSNTTLFEKCMKTCKLENK
jgi:cytochrome c biogenesis factor